MDKLFTPIDIYCERTSDLMWAEPVNAFTNFFFVIAGLHILYLLKKQGNSSLWLQALSVNTILVGLGSFLFHTFANFWSMWADILPIMILICANFYFVLKYIFRFSHLYAGIFIFLFFLLGFALTVVVPPILNGSLMYAHALVALIAVAWLTKSRHKKISRFYFMATLVFIFSLFFRTVDPSACEFFPLGTHFLWHTLNSVTIWLVLKGNLELKQ
ncbi:MAG: ceramidase domain-containing protein [Bdellovibrionales bacterium]|nr:ceramidase domain-containing protein [Bdellovibrionales bacterium]